MLNMRETLPAGGLCCLLQFPNPMDGVHLSSEGESMVCSRFISNDGYYVMSSSSESTLGR